VNDDGEEAVIVGLILLWVVAVAAILYCVSVK